MSVKRIFSHKLTLFFWFSIIVTAAFFQNCGRVTLMRPKKLELPSIARGDVTTRLPPPVIAPGRMRVLFFVDQSYSMIRKRCPQDLDNPNESEIDNIGNIANCTYEAGVDIDGDRFSAISQWLNQLEVIAHGSLTSEHVKVAIIPFSGGKFERPNIAAGDDPNDFKFKTLADAKVWLEKLKEEHTADLEFAKNGIAPKKMGVTVPAPTLGLASGLLTAEMSVLKTQDPDLIKTTPFHFVYLSDGVFKPLESYLAKAKRIIGCADCTQQPSHPSCQCGGVIIGGTMCAATYCNQHVPWQFRLAFGEASTNKLQNIVDLLAGISALPATFGSAPINIHLVKIHPERVLGEDKDEPITAGIKSVFDGIYEKLPSAKKHVLNSPDVPFSFSTGAGAFLSFELDQFYVVNLNAFVDSTGKLVIDSDSDGLGDDEEEKAVPQTNPTRYREDSVEGCMGRIKKMYGCKIMNCLKDFDKDGDGLGQCEELAAETKQELADSDDDRVLDYLETLRALNPNGSDSYSFEAGESSYNDLAHFFFGIHPSWKVSKTDPRIQVSVELRPAGFDEIPAIGGTPVTLGKYVLKVTNIPIVKTRLANGKPKLYRDVAMTQEIPSDLIVGPTDHGEGINQILMLARAAAIENRNISYWLIKKIEIKHTRTNHFYQFNVDLSQFKQLELGKKP